MSTGTYLTEYVSDIDKYLISSDKSVIKLMPSFKYIDFYLDVNMVGIGFNRVKEFYKREVTKLMVRSGRLESNYKSSVSTLRSSVLGIKSPRKPYEKVSDFVGLGFVETHINAKFTHDEYLANKVWMDKYNIIPKLSDSGDDYCGIRLDECIFIELNKVLVKYDVSEFPGIKRELHPAPPDELLFSKYELSELKLLDRDDLSQIIFRLCELSEIDKSEVLRNQRILGVIGHLNITLANLNKTKYSISFNRVDWHGMIDQRKRLENGVTEIQLHVQHH
jgi:hypothetical protein